MSIIDAAMRRRTRGLIVPDEDRRSAWVNGYIGIPYVSQGRDRFGVDCWGLVRIVYWDRQHIALPSYASDYSDSAERDEVGRIIRAERAEHGGGLWYPVDVPDELDLVLLRIGGVPCHVGIWIVGDRLLNVRRGCDTVLEKLGGPQWRNRIEGCYRHRDLWMNSPS